MGIAIFIGGIGCMVFISKLAEIFIKSHESMSATRKWFSFGVFNIVVSFLLPVLTSEFYLKEEQEKFVINMCEVILAVGILSLLMSIIFFIVSKKQAV